MTILWGFTENAQENRILFWQSILRYQQVIPYNFEKFCSLFIKMTVADQIKTLDKKIKQNEAQYDLDRNSATISAWPSKILPKYKHLTGGVLG